jgi:hypothetical protein
VSRAAPPAANPQEAVQRMLHVLAERQHALALQVQTLRALRQRLHTAPGCHVQPDVLLALYLDMPSAEHVARACTAAGWTLPGAKGARQVQAPDVYQAIRRGTPAQVSPALQAMAREKLARRASV